MRHERRRHPRLEIPLETDLRLAGSESEITATMEDLSAGGAGLLTTFEIPVGTQVESLHFNLPADAAGESQSIEVAAQVARCEQQEGVSDQAEYLIGLQFVGISRELFDRIQGFVFKCLRADQKERVEIERPIAIRFDRFDDFVDEVSVNLSSSGMFIRTRDPRPPGSVFNFQFQLGEDFSLIEGRAVVVWRRRQSEGPDKPPGMGVKFQNLDVPSQQLIDRLISQRREEKRAAPDTAQAEATAAAETAAPLPEEVAATPEAVQDGPKPPPDLERAEAATVGLGEIDALRNTVYSLREELEKAKRTHERELQELRARMEGRQAAATSELEERLREAESAHRESERQGAELTGELEGARQEPEELHQRIAAAPSAVELERIVAERDELQGGLDWEHEEVERVKTELAELQAARKGLEFELGQARAAAGELEARLAARATEEEVQQLISDRDAAQAAHDEARATRTRLEGELERVREEAGALQAQLDDRTFEEQIEQLIGERNALRVTRDRLLADADRANVEADEIRLRLADDTTRREIERVIAERDELQAAHEELQALHDGGRAAKVRLEGELAQAREERERLEADAARERETLQEEAATAAREAAAELESLRQELDEARRREEVLEGELAALREEGERARTAAAEEAETELAGARAEGERLRGELDSALERHLGLESGIQQVRDEARQAALQSEERETALRAELENARLAATGGVPLEAAEPRHGRRTLAAAALLVIGALLGLLAVSFVDPLGSLAQRLRGVPGEGPVVALRTDPQATSDTGPASTPEPPAAVPEESATESDSTATEPTPAAPAPPTEPPPPAEPTPDPAAAERAVRDWAAAWSDQRVDDYLACYADTFQLPDGQSRQAWAAARRQRIERPRSIQVGVEAPRTVELAADRVSVSFDQTYASDTFSDRVRKTLLFVWQDGVWKIVEERVIE